MVADLNRLPWQRIVVSFHYWPIAKNAHVFLIGKSSEQFAQEHRMSRECIQELAAVLEAS